MDKVAKSSISDRKDLFNETAARMELNPVIIEKDFWVCWMLKQLFTIKELDGMLVFKGGTSLSKCFNLIHRFSEDIDIAVDFEELGFIGMKDPRRAGLSNTRRAVLLKEMLTACQEYIARELAPILTARIKDVLGAKDWKLLINTNDSNIVEFEYPTSIKAKLDYIRPRVILELGTHAEPVPNEDYDVMPFAAEHFPQLFIEPACSVSTVVARRTFWEKATILHAEYHRPLVKLMPLRYSRHYADVAVMSQAQVVDEALADIELLNSVTIHKDLFYHSGWAQYNLARPGSFYLMPRGERLSAIGRDYREMSAMFFSEPPEFESILEQLLELEKRINNT
ncbi:MAG: nucleotidyl transferase AbiEii/AbiGii toxin family protein [Planctomycetes bacterium]|nr:nucleotidyl transferase AbiEii/AbiGii toxin family protein [Planctomycetota bacterium]